MDNLNIGMHQERPDIDYMACVGYQNIHNQSINNSFHDLLDININIPKPGEICNYDTISCGNQHQNDEDLNCFVYPQNHLILQDEIDNFPQQNSMQRSILSDGIEHINIESGPYYIDNEIDNSKKSCVNNLYPPKSPLYYCNGTPHGYNPMFEYTQKQKIQYGFINKGSELTSQLHTATAAQPAPENFIYHTDPSWKNFRTPYVNNPSALPSDAISSEKTPTTRTQSPNGSKVLTYPATSVIAWLRDIIKSCIRDPESEFTLTVSQPKVAQKSYGDEKRFLTPPIIVLSGNGWGISLECEEHKKSFNIQNATTNSEQLDDGKKALLLCRVLFSIPHPPTTIIFRPICRHKTGSLEVAKTSIRPQKPAVAAFLQKLHVDATDPRKEVAIQYKIVCPIGIFNIDAPPMVKLSKPSKRKRASFSSLLIRSNTIASFFNRTKSQSSSTTFLGSNGAELTPCNGPQEDWIVHLVSKNAFENYLRSIDTNLSSLDREYLYKANKNGSSMLTPSTTPGSICNKFPEVYESESSLLLCGFTYPVNFFVDGNGDSDKNTPLGAQGREGPVLHYGDIVVLKNLSTGFVTCPFILRRVEKTGWCIVEEDYENVGNDPDVGGSTSYSGFRSGECIPPNPGFNCQSYKTPITYFKRDTQRNNKIPISPLHRIAFELALRPMHFLCLNTGRKVQSPTVGISSAVNSFVPQSNVEESADHATMHKNTPNLYGKICHKPAQSSIQPYRNIYGSGRCDSRRPRIASSPYPLQSLEQSTPRQQKNRQRGTVSFDIDIGEACVWTVISIIRKECTFMLKKSSELSYPAQPVAYGGLGEGHTPTFTDIPDIKRPHMQVDFITSGMGQAPVEFNYDCIENEQCANMQGGEDQYRMSKWSNYCRNVTCNRHIHQPNLTVDFSQHPEAPSRTIVLDPIPEIYSISLFPSVSDQASSKGKVVIVAFGKNLIGTYLFFGIQNTEDMSVSSEGNIIRCTISTQNLPDSQNVPILIARNDGLIFKSGWQWNPKDSTVSATSIEDFDSSVQ